MTKILTPLPEIETRNIVDNRRSLSSSQANFIDKEINIKFALDKPVIPLNVRITPLTFVNCIFNENVSLGDYSCAGTIDFKNCQFKKDVFVWNLENISFSPDCQFRSNLEVSISNFKSNLDIPPFIVTKDLIIQGNSTIVVTLKT